MAYGVSPSTAKLLQDAVGGLAMGLGYTTGAYTGYGISNTADPLGIHNRKSYYNRPQHIQLGMAYCMSGYGSYRRRYRYSRYRRYGRYSRYRRRSYYRRRYY